MLAGGGLVCASATALAEGMPPAAKRPEPIRLEVGAEPGLDGLSEQLALAGYERVERAEERGQFAVRGGLVDVFPTTGREPLRVELFGDEIEQVRAFSPFTQRALHPVDGAVVYPAAERRADLTEPTLLDDDQETYKPEIPRDLVHVLDRAPDFVWQPDEVRRVWAEEGLEPISLKGASELDPFPQAQPFSFEAQRPAIAARGLAEAENELNGFVRGGNRVVVAFPHAGEALRTENLLKRADARVLDAGQDLPEQPELLFAVAPARRGFVWRELGLVLLPDTQVFRKRPPRADQRLGRALASFADLRTGDFIVHEDHGVGKLLGFETKEVAGVTRDYLFLAFRGEDRLYVPHEQLGKVSKYIGADASAPALSKLGGKAWQNLKARARESVQRARDRADRALRAAPAGAGHGVRAGERVARAARGRVPLPRDRGPGARDRGGQGGSRGAAARWTGSSAATSASARPRSRSGPPSPSPSTASRRSSSARRRSSPSSTGTRSRPATATSPSGSRWSRASASPPRRSRS